MKRSHYFLLIFFLFSFELLGALYFAQNDIASRFRFLNQLIACRAAPHYYAFDSALQVLFPLSCVLLFAMLKGGKRFFSTPVRHTLEPLRQLLLMLTVIALPASCLEGEHSMGTRSRLARVYGDMRTLSIAVSTYQLDHSSPPDWAAGAESANRYLNPAAPAYRIPTFRVLDAASRRPLQATLLAPLSYISGYPQDEFAVGRNRGATFGYYADRRGYILFSPGPDLHYDFQPSDFGSPSAIRLKTYDPTNGILSGGDSLRYSPVDGGCRFRLRPP